MKTWIAATWFYIVILCGAWLIGFLFDAFTSYHNKTWHHMLVGVGTFAFIGMTYWSLNTLNESGKE